MAQANVKLTVDASQATRALKGVQAQSTGLQNNLGKLKAAFAGIAFTAVARQAVMTSANFQKLNVRLGLLTKASGTFARSQELAAQAQRTFGLSATEALEGITDITARLQPLGVSVDDIKTTFFGFNTAAKLAGASAIESSNAFRQLAQALGSGRLQGDEFRSISEQIPTILKPVADELGTTVGELKKFSSEGKITSAVVIRALKKIENEGGKSLAALLKNDPTQVFKNLSNETENLSRAFGDRLAPAVLPVIRGISDVTKAISNFVNSGAGEITLIFTGLAVAIKGVLIVTPLLSAQILALKANFAGLVVGAKIFTGSLVGVKAMLAANTVGFATATAAANTFKIALAKTGIGIAVIALGALAAKFIDNQNSAKAAAAEIKAFDDNLKGIIGTAADTEAALNQIAIANKKFEISQVGTGQGAKGRLRRLEKELEILQDQQFFLDKEKKRQKEIDKDKKFNDLTIAQLKEINTLEDKLSGKTDEQLTLEDKINEIKKEYTGEDAKQLINNIKIIDGLKKKNEELEKNKKATEELKQKFVEIGKEIEQGLKDNLREAITGAQSFGDAMRNVINQIRDKLIDLALDKVFDGIAQNFGNAVGNAASSGGSSSGGGGKTKFGAVIGGAIGGPVGAAIGSFLPFAEGGKPPVGKPSIVGEKGPELFVPRTAGTIIPNDQMGGGIVVNVSVDASGSAVSGSDQKGNQFGQELAIVIQQEIIRQKRSGGLLA